MLDPKYALHLCGSFSTTSLCSAVSSNSRMVALLMSYRVSS